MSLYFKSLSSSSCWSHFSIMRPWQPLNKKNATHGKFLRRWHFFCCGQPNTVVHVMLQCVSYEEAQRIQTIVASHCEDVSNGLSLYWCGCVLVLASLDCKREWSLPSDTKKRRPPEGALLSRHRISFCIWVKDAFLFCGTGWCLLSLRSLCEWRKRA